MTMTMRAKILTLLISLTILFSVGVYISQIHETKKLDRFMKSIRTEKEVSYSISIESHGNILKTFAYDYTFWDEMVKFVETRDRGWARVNIETALPVFNAHYVWVYESDFDLVYSVNVPGFTRVPNLPFTRDELRKITGEEKFNHFFLLLDSMLCEIRTAPIQPGEDQERNSAPSGYFFTGRCWTKEVLNNLISMTGSNINLILLSPETLGNKIQETSEYTIVLSRLFYTWDGKPIARLVSVSEQSFLREVMAFSRTHFILLILFSVVVMVIISVFLIHNLDRPVKTISASLKQSNPKALAILKTKKTEFGTVATLIDQFFGQKEKLVREYEERIRAERRAQDIVENAPFGILFIRYNPDEQLILMGANLAADKILNREHQLLVGKTIEEIYPTLAQTEVPDAYRKIARTGERYDSDGVVVLRGEIRLTFEIHAFLYGPNLIASFFQEVTERKRTENALRASEEKFRNLVENMLDLVWQSDAKGRFTYISPNITHLLGYQPEEVIGRLSTDYMASDDRANLDKEIADFIRNQQSIRGLSFDLIHKNGYRVAFELNASPLIDSEGKCLGFVGICRDITLRRQLEAEQIKVQKLESLGVLAGGIAHDFNNILTGILGNISLANMGTDDPKISALLDEAEKASMDARDLVRKLLTFAKGGAPIKEKISLEEIIRETSKFALSGSPTEISYNFSENLPQVALDRDQFNQVVQNIILNSVQAMPDGGKISIVVDTVSGLVDLPSASDRYIRIRISDTGVGIPEENIERVFDPYFTTKEFGSGMGLSVAYSIIKRHGGHINATSRIGEGTTFSIFLPAEEEPLAINHTTPWKVPKGSGHILVMDDEKMILDVVQAMLKKLGYSVTCAKEGRQVLEKYQTALASGQPFDAVIMDLTIVGGMGGKDTIRELRKIAPDIPALASSGYATDPIMAEPHAYGFDGVISKPYNMQILGTELHRVLKSRSARIG